MIRTREIIKVIEAIDLNIEAEEFYLDVQATFYGPMGEHQMVAVFHGDADPERIAIVCRAIRQAIDGTP